MLVLLVQGHTLSSKAQTSGHPALCCLRLAGLSAVFLLVSPTLLVSDTSLPTTWTWCPERRCQDEAAHLVFGPCRSAPGLDFYRTKFPAWAQSLGSIGLASGEPGLCAVSSLLYRAQGAGGQGWVLYWLDTLEVMLCVFPGTDGLADGPTTRGRAGPEATAALPIPAALLPAAAHEGHPGALQTCCQAGGSSICWAMGSGYFL